MTLVYLLLVLILGLGSEISALTGCLASLLPNIYFYFKMLRRAENDNAAEWLGYAYRSDVGKWIMAVILFVLIFSMDYEWDPVLLFVGYLLVQMSGLFLPFIQKGN